MPSSYIIEVFVSYSREDQELFKELDRHLTLVKRQKAIRIWEHGRIVPGQAWQSEIDQRLESADLVLLLLSPSFLGSDHCCREADRAMERFQRDGVTVIPVILRPCDWRNTDYAKLQALPEGGESVAESTGRDAAFNNVVAGIRKAIDELRPPSTTNSTDGSELVYVPSGIYAVGTEDLSDVEQPIHEIRLNGFRIGRIPVTNEQYRRFLAANPECPEPRYQNDDHFGDPQQPVVGVTWREARAYCRWAGLELPSEAQWEAAARGRDGRRYPWGDQEPTSGRACFGKKSHPERVGSYPGGEGPYGTLDQAGNVWEWCRDRYFPSAYVGRNGQPDPVILGDEVDDTVLRVVRGGSCRRPARHLHAAYRLKYPAGNWDTVLGFRVVLEIPKSSLRSE